ncbi:hypothetical protein [Streptomyces atroolivaceus]|uniref:hypothetical protein n=1 Tax=Streptomyces atroolivaceus TaxID=66869 RepID=UPI00379B837B
MVSDTKTITQEQSALRVRRVVHPAGYLTGDRHLGSGSRLAHGAYLPGMRAALRS